MSLIEASEARTILGIRSPSELYWVLKSPAPLSGMRYPRWDFPWEGLSAAGFGVVIALEPGDYDPSPLKLLFSQRLEDLCHGGSPRSPNTEQGLITEAVKTAVNSLQSGKGVVVHCQGGRGRTGTVIGGVLRRLGYGAGDVIAYLNRIHRARGKPGWPESPWQSQYVESSIFDS